MQNTDGNIYLSLINLVLVALTIIYLGLLVPYLLNGKKKDSNYFLYLSVTNITAGCGHLLIYGSFLLSGIFVVIGIALAIYGYILKNKESIVEDKPIMG